MRHLLAAALLAALALPGVSGPAFAADPPQARRVDAIDHDFGLTLPDPYRWMEGEDNAEFNAWLKARGAASRAKLDAYPTLAAWRERLAKTATAGTASSDVRPVGDRLFFMRSRNGAEAVLMLREADGRERMVYDTTLDKGAILFGYEPSPDGSKVAINVGRDGNEIGELAVLDVASGKKLESLAPVWSEFAANWLPDGSGFFYTRMRDAKPGDADPLQGMGAYLHRLGEAQAADRLVAQAGAADALKIAANDFPFVQLTHGSRWAVLEIAGARPNGRACVAPAEDAIAGKAQWRCLVDDADAMQANALHGDTWYLLRAGKASNRELLALDLSTPGATLAQARVVVPERSDTVLERVLGVARDALYLKTMRRGIDHLERLDYATGKTQPVDTPDAGTIRVHADPRIDGAIVSLGNWTRPVQRYRYLAGRPLQDLMLGATGMPEYPDLVAEDVDATSADGTKVPMSVIRPRALPLDGRAKAMVEGYGGYGMSISPAFIPVLLEWSQAGNVGAVCHVRGGGENGDAWRTGGSGPNKQRGVEDFIACARELAKRGYSAPSRIGGFGGSMGGILTGGAYTTSPESWGAMAIQSGILNPVRLLAAKNGANQIAEMGDPRTAAGLRQLLAMDPYQHVRKGVRYPPLLLVTGAVDQRVAPWNSGKFGAQVMAAAPATPVLFRTDDQFGHFATNDSAAAIEFADIYAFMDAMLH